MGRSSLRLINILLVMLFVHCGKAQIKWNKWLSLEIGSAYGNRILLSANPSATYGYSEQELSDSFIKWDGYTELYHAGLGIYFQSNPQTTYYLGASVSEWGFERLKEGNMFGFQPHPELNVYPALTQGGTQQLIFQFKQRYIEFTSRYLHKLNGQRLQLGTEFELWVLGEANIGWLIGDEMIINSRGFSLVEGDKIVKYDYTEKLNSDGTVTYDKVINPKMNASMGIGVRAEYHLDQKWSVDALAIVKSMLSPNHTGVLTGVGHQFGIQLGIQYKIPN